MKALSKLKPFLRPYWKQVFIALVCILSLTAANLAIPAIIRQVIDIGLTGRQVTFLILSAVIILGIGILQAVLTYSQSYVSEWIASHVGYDLRNRLYDHIQHLSFSFHDHTQTGQLISRCIEDVRSIERFTGHGLVELARLSLLLAGIVFLLFWQNPTLAVIALLPMIPMIWLTADFGLRIGSMFLAVDRNLGKLSSRLQENISGVQVVRAFAREPYEMDLFDHANRELYHARVTVVSEWAKIMPSSHFLVTLSTILILWFGGQMVLRGEMSIGEMVAFNGYLLLLAQPVQQLTWLVNMAGEAVAGVQRTFEVLELEPEIQSLPDAVVLPPLQGRVTFEGVSFHYSGQTSPALEDINFDIEPNQVVALIGATGSGKTSLVNLIPRFYDTSQGSVRVDGYDVRQVDLFSLRSQIGIVLQTSLLFSTSVRENIAYGKPQASLDEVIEAARAAQAHEFIQVLPEGYDTVVGERGITLSGGQRQRVAIARALLMDPRILILDDSTSSVDTETEQLIQQAMKNMMEGRTTFVIAHRLSTIRRADLILVMDQGRIVERGKHEELLKRKGDGPWPSIYRQIYELQLRKQEQAYDHELSAEKEALDGDNRPENQGSSPN